MKHIKLRFTWILFYCISFLMLLLNTKVKQGYFKNFILELKTILQHKNPYLEGNDFRLVHKDNLDEDSNL